MEKNCQSCGHRCMDMDMEPYCTAPAVVKKHPFGLTLSRNQIPECKKKADGVLVYTLWVKDTRRV